MKKKKATIKDLAEKANVSTATVSRALNGTGIVKKSTLKLIQDTAMELGYELPAPPISSPSSVPVLEKNISSHSAPSSSDRITIMIHITDISNPFYSQVIKGIEASMSNNGNYQFFLYTKKIDNYTLPDFFHLINAMHIAGMISVNLTDTNILKEISEHIPIVQCGEFVETPYSSSVGINDYSATQQALDYFLSMHRTKIGMINGPIQYRYAQNRLAAFKSITKAAGLSIPPQWILQLPELNHDMAFSSVVQLLNASDSPDCFFCVSDVLAAAAVRAVQYCNMKTPEDILIIGFDNIIISQLTTPSITTVSQPQFQLGFLAGEMLLEKITNPISEVKHIMLNTELIIRESTSITA